MITVRDLRYHLPNKREILKGIDFQLNEGEFLAVLGENGAGKTTLLDTLMGFRVRASGECLIFNEDPNHDPWDSRAYISYLSEKVDIPGDWHADEFLQFHRHFYHEYDTSYEKHLMEIFGLTYDTRAGNLSAGELRRLHIVGALATKPKLVVADEITAVLDILGRRKFLKLLQEQQKSRKLSVVLATNVPEGLEAYADHILLISKGQQIAFSNIKEFLGKEDDLADVVANRLESL